ncbi:MAG: NAD(+)/NADH kinase [Lachnospiraceae bacterium]|nr:NAD(+)/NADH kinase [Lachnospiraceae bacterium]
MERFYLIVNDKKDPKLQEADRLRTYLLGQGAACKMVRLGQLKSVPDGTECCIVLGGDGSLLQASAYATEKGIPLIGINLGTVGYLTEVELSSATDALTRLLDDEFVIEYRMMLQGILRDAKGRETVLNYALNDVVIARFGAIHLIRLQVYINDLFLCTYDADGLIVCTPTGSTGYNMSVGGPVVEPDADLMLMTPIAPLKMMNRSIVLSSEDRLRIVVDQTHDDIKTMAAVSFDAENVAQIMPGSEIIISRAERETALIRLHDDSFVDVLHKKMN